jgi:nicotinate-nucleotide pyrophosphorylase
VLFLDNLIEEEVDEVKQGLRNLLQYGVIGPYDAEEIRRHGVNAVIMGVPTHEVRKRRKP